MMSFFFLLRLHYSVLLPIWAAAWLLEFECLSISRPHWVPVNGKLGTGQNFTHPFHFCFVTYVPCWLANSSMKSQVTGFLLNITMLTMLLWACWHFAQSTVVFCLDAIDVTNKNKNVFVTGMTQQKWPVYLFYKQTNKQKKSKALSWDITWC